MKKTLLVRFDKIGDLICTLPVDQMLSLETSVHWLLSDQVKGLMPYVQPIRTFESFPLSFQWKNFFQLLKWLRQQKFDQCIVFYAPNWVLWALFFSGIPQRFGRLSKPLSWLVFHKGLRQSRSQSLEHEYSYNQDLMLAFLEKMSGWKSEDLSALKEKTKSQYLQLQAPSQLQWIERFGLYSGFTVVHPGMSGSALNWPSSSYQELITQLLSQGKTVVITGTRSDEAYLTPLRPLFEKHPKVIWLAEKLDFGQLLFVLSRAEAVLAPSTGVLHLATSLGKKSVGLYSPLKAHSHIRWGPRGPAASVLAPNVTCPAGQGECLKSACSFHPCMAKISVADVLASLLAKN
jgi:heptosyltransferase I